MDTNLDTNCDKSRQQGYILLLTFFCYEVVVAFVCNRGIKYFQKAPSFESKEHQKPLNISGNWECEFYK